MPELLILIGLILFFSAGPFSYYFGHGYILVVLAAILFAVALSRSVKLKDAKGKRLPLIGISSLLTVIASIYSILLIWFLVS